MWVKRTPHWDARIGWDAFPGQDSLCLSGKWGRIKQSLVLRSCTMTPSSRAMHLNRRDRPPWLVKPAFNPGNLRQSMNSTKPLTYIHTNPISHSCNERQGPEPLTLNLSGSPIWRFRVPRGRSGRLKMQRCFLWVFCILPFAVPPKNKLMLHVFVQHSIVWFVKFLPSFLIQRK